MSDAIPFVFRKFSMMVDGTIRVVVDVEPNDAAGVFSLFNEPNIHGAMVRMNIPSVGEEVFDGQKVAEIKTVSMSDEDGPCKTVSGEYGMQAKALKLSGFFRCEAVWPHIGTDAEFLDWLRGEKCVVCRHEPPSEAAHVRRVANGAGTGIKPKYSAVPLCRKHHAMQHQHGELAVESKEFFDLNRIKALELWAWETLKAALGYCTWKDIPPRVLYDWAEWKGVARLLPDEYKEHL